MAMTVRAKIDTELTRRVGKWFTVRDLQDKLGVKAVTLKPLIMKYARENLLKRRNVKGTSRAVQFSPAASNLKSFMQLMAKNMPYRNLRGNKGLITEAEKSGIGNITAVRQAATKSKAKPSNMKKKSKMSNSTKMKGASSSARRPMKKSSRR